MKLEMSLDKLKREQARMQNRRAAEKRTKQELAESDPEIAAKLRKFNREKVGRPPIETDQPFLHECILRIASAGAAADGRRRTETVQPCLTLSDLTEAVKREGFQLSQSGLYLRYANF